MNPEAQKVFEYLEGKGKVSGGTVKADLDLKDSEWRKVKDELKEAGVVTTGRGRGGTITRIDGAEPPAEATKKLSKTEIMAAAREEKVAKSKVMKFHQEIKEYGEKIAAEKFPENRTEVHVIRADYNSYWGEFHIWVWDGKKAKPHQGFYDRDYVE